MDHMSAAQDLAWKFRDECRGLNIYEVCRAWERYSAKYSAGWLSPGTGEAATVQRVMDEERDYLKTV